MNYLFEENDYLFENLEGMRSALAYQRGREWREKLPEKGPLRDSVNKILILLHYANEVSEGDYATEGIPLKKEQKSAAILLVAFAYAILKEKFSEKTFYGDKKKRDLHLKVLKRLKKTHFAFKKRRGIDGLKPDAPERDTIKDYLQKAVNEMARTIESIDSESKLEKTFKHFITIASQISDEKAPIHPRRAGGTDYRKQIAIISKKLLSLSQKLGKRRSARMGRMNHDYQKILKLVIDGQKAGQISIYQAKQVSRLVNLIRKTGNVFWFDEILKILEVNFAKDDDYREKLLKKHGIQQKD
jgi:hypothetical protein